jgi:hypothetical protein
VSAVGAVDQSHVSVVDIAGPAEINAAVGSIEPDALQLQATLLRVHRATASRRVLVSAGRMRWTARARD